MTDLCRLIFWTLVDLMRARATLEAEIWVLRQQINVLRRAAPRRQSFGIFDRLIFVGLYRLFPKTCDALAIVKPDTIIRWHRAGFSAYWRWKSRRRGGRPTVPSDIRKLIHEMSIANPLWGAPRIHGELLKLGIEIGQTSVAKYRERPAIPGLEDVPPQSCRRHRGDGSVRRTDDLISLALWLINHGAWSTAGFMVWRYRASDCRMDRKSDHASVRLEAGPSLSDPRPGRGLWRSLYSKSSIVIDRRRRARHGKTHVLND